MLGRFFTGDSGAALVHPPSPTRSSLPLHVSDEPFWHLRHVIRIARLSLLADRARHAGACAGTGSVADPWAVRVVLADPPAVVAALAEPHAFTSPYWSPKSIGQNLG